MNNLAPMKIVLGVQGILNRILGYYDLHVRHVYEQRPYNVTKTSNLAIGKNAYAKTVLDLAPLHISISLINSAI